MTASVFLDILAQSDRIYWFLAVVGSVIFIVQFMMGIFGAEFGDHMTAGDMGQVEVGDHGDIATLNFFSLKSIIAFITFFGWAGVLWGNRSWLGLGIAFLTGLVMMALTATSVWLMLKLQKSGNVLPSDLVGQSGTVYLKIPAERGAGGKVTVRLAGCTRLVRAVCDKALPTGTSVKVLEHIEGDCYLVDKIDG